MTSTTFDKDEFKDVMEVARLGLAKSDLIPSLQTFKIQKNKVTSWNDIIGVTVELPENVIEDNSICPKGAALANFVKQAGGETVTTQVNENSLKVVSGSTQMNVPIQDSEAFPNLPEGDRTNKEWSVQVNASQVAFALDKCLKTVGSQRDFLIYNSICIGNDPESGNLAFYSSDNISLSSYVTDEYIGDIGWVLVPKDFAKAIITAISKLGENEEITITSYPNFIKMYIHSGVDLIGRRVSASPPDYSQPIKQFVDNINSEDDVFPITPDIKTVVDRMKNILPTASQVKIATQGTKFNIEAFDTEGQARDQEEIPHAVTEDECVIGIDRLQKAVAVGDFMFVNEDVIGVLNDPMPSASNYIHLVSAMN